MEQSAFYHESIERVELTDDCHQVQTAAPSKSDYDANS